MIAWGNLIASYHRRELEQIAACLESLSATARPETRRGTSARAGEGRATGEGWVNGEDRGTGFTGSTAGGDGGDVGSGMQHSPTDYFLPAWSSDDALTGEELLGLAESLDLEQLGWLAEGGLPGVGS